MTRVLRNLVTNAATHGGGCEVSVYHQASRAVVLIEDRGPGIPDSVMGRVFEPFFRSDPARQQTIPGAGLGLAIAREIVARHDGEIILANRSGGGLHQEIRLPRHLDQPPLSADGLTFTNAARPTRRPNVTKPEFGMMRDTS